MKQIVWVKFIAVFPLDSEISLKDIATEADIIKYGEIIGKSTVHICVEEYAHIDNVVSNEIR